jgi:4-amino-4-deoxy-L-arabinose transferase-like glycosyltransferase
MKFSDRTRTLFILFGLIVLCFVLFQFGNGTISLTDPDDVFYADTAKEMLSHHSWLTPLMFGQPQFEKPPLYYWFLMLAFQLFGVTAVAARLVGVVIGCASVLGTFLFVRRLIDQQIALTSAVVLASSIWWIGLSRVVLTDLLFSALIMFSLYSFLVWYAHRRTIWLTAFGICTGLATLAKSPLGLLLPVGVIVIFLLIEREHATLRRFLFSHWWLVAAVISVPWYLYCIATYGNQFVWEFFVHDHWHRLLRAEHSEFNKWYFYLVAVGFGFIPWTPYVVLIKGAIKSMRSQVLFCTIWIATFGLFFTLAQSKLTTYISPIYPALAILTAIGIHAIQPVRWPRMVSGALLAILAIGLSAGASIVATKYPEFAAPALLAFGSLAGILVVSAVLMFMNRVMPSVVVSAAGIAVFSLLAGGFVFGHLEAGLTQTNLIPLISKHGYEGKTVLCSKLYVRGIFFYTENPVVVMSANQQPFWSNHPVPIMSSDAQVTDFMQSHDTLLCVLSGGDLGRFTRLYPSDGKIDTLASDMGKTVIMSYLHPTSQR